MASAFVTALQTQMTQLQAQITVLLSLPVAADYSLDGESVPVGHALDLLMERQKKLAELIRVNSPYEVKTRPLMS